MVVMLFLLLYSSVYASGSDWVAARVSIPDTNRYIGFQLPLVSISAGEGSLLSRVCIIEQAAPSGVHVRLPCFDDGVFTGFQLSLSKTV